MKIETTPSRPRAIIEAMAEKMGVSTQSDFQEEILTLPETHGQGKVFGFDFGNGLGILVADCKLREPWQITLQGNSPPLLFNFNVRGTFWHYFDNGNVAHQFAPLQGTIAANTAGNVQRFEFSDNVKLTFMLIFIQRKEYLKKYDHSLEYLPKQLVNVFLDWKGQRAFFYQNAYSMVSADFIRKIIQDKNKGLVRSTFVEAKTLELLYNQLKQYHEDFLVPGKKVQLREHDIAKLQEAHDLLVRNLKNPPTIAELARQVGINRQKLKSGFKLLYDATINEYVRNERLEQASIHILRGESVLQAMRNVGYSNRGHFSRKFEEKYGVLPKDYLKSIQSKIPD